MIRVWDLFGELFVVGSDWARQQSDLTFGHGPHLDHKRLMNQDQECKFSTATIAKDTFAD